MITFDYDKSYRKGRLICDEEILTFVRNHFSVKNPNASFANKKLKLKGSSYTVPDRDYAISKVGAFDMGMYESIRSFLRSENIIELECTQAFTERLICGFGDVGVSDTLRHNLRDYQMETVERCLKLGYGTILVATGGGKSLIQASLLENWKLLNGHLKCLLVVPGTGLVSQLVKDFEDYNVTFTYSGWTGDMEKQDTEVIIVNTELLCSQFGNFKELVGVDIVLRDECFKAGTLIDTINGKIKIENIRVGDVVMSKSVDGVNEWKSVTNTWKNLPKSESEEFIKISLENGGSMVVTPDHIIYTVNGKRKASELTERDELISYFNV